MTTPSTCLPHRRNLFQMSLVLIALLLTSSLTYAQDRERARTEKKREKVQSGSLELELDQAVKDPYSETETASLVYFKFLQTKIAALPGSAQTVEPPGDAIIQYLNGLYLLCSMKRGTCPTILDALLEVDLINSKINKQTACPTMKRFWKQYIDGDLEKRHRYQTQTGHITAVTDFNQKIRPRYIKCAETITQLLEGSASDTAFFQKRYAGDPPPVLAVRSVIDMINQVQSKNLNVFAVTGMK